MKKDAFDRGAFLKGAVAGGAAAVTVSIPRPSEARDRADLIEYMQEAFK